MKGNLLLRYDEHLLKQKMNLIKKACCFSKALRLL